MARSVPILNHVRWIAATAVVFSHLRNILLVEFHDVPNPGILTKLFYYLTGFGHFAVVVFFVLSGYLVGSKALDLLHTDSLDRDWKKFVIDRFARIFIVFVPALLLSGAVLLCGLTFFHSKLFVTNGWSAGWIAPLPHDAKTSLWVGGLFLVNGIFVDTISVNGALWSLAYEWFYYVAAAGIVVFYRKYWNVATSVFVLYVAAVSVGVVLNNLEVLVGAVSWIAGTVASRIAEKGYMKSRLSWIAGILAFLAATILFRSHPLLPDPIWALCIAFSLSHSRWYSVAPAPDLGKSLADFSYTLYVIHVPIIAFLVGCFQSAGFLSERMQFTTASACLVASGVFLVLIIARIFALFTEDKTPLLRNWLLRLAA